MRSSIQFIPPWITAAIPEKGLLKSTRRLLKQKKYIDANHSFFLRKFALNAGISLIGISENSIGVVLLERVQKAEELELQVKEGKFFFSLN